jgi:hypothetical protein
MEILINKKYRLTSDSYNYMLEKSFTAGDKSKKAGEIGWKTIGYYSTISAALKGLLDKVCKSSKAKSIEDLERLVSSVKSDIDKVLSSKGL